MPDPTSPRCGILIPIRLASERLPGKALLDVAGRPAFHHLLDRAAACRHVAREDVVVCTTREASDDPLAEAVREYGAGLYRGSTEDLIRRFHDAIAAFGFDLVVEADGDDLCCATEYMDACFDALIADPGIDVVTCAELPLGAAPRGFTRSAMERVFAHYRTEANDTGFFHLFTRTGLCHEQALAPLSPGHRHARARLTLDYPEDLEFFRRLLAKLGRPGAPAPLAEIVALLEAAPELVELNQSVAEDFWRRTAAKTRLAYCDAEGRMQEITL